MSTTVAIDSGSADEQARHRSPIRVDSGEVVDAACSSALVMLAMAGLGSTFGGWRYLLAGLVGCFVGLSLSRLTRTLRWPWPTTTVIALVAYLVGGTVILYRQPGHEAGLVASLQTVAAFAVFGWKDLLTTLPPVDETGPFIVLCYLLALFGAAWGFDVSRRTRRSLPVLAVPAALFVAVILLGAQQDPADAARGVAAAAVSIGWIGARWARQDRVADPQGASRRLGALVLAVVAVGLPAGHALVAGTGEAHRLVLRDHVQPPFDISRYPSPLAGLRKYLPGAAQLWDHDLVEVQGAPTGSLLRIGVLEDYDGTVWSAAGPDGDDTGRDGFRSVGSRIGTATDVPGLDVTLTIQPAYAAASDLNAWLPGLGLASRVAFDGPDAATHRGYFRYNLDTGQGVVPDRLRAGDVIELRTDVVPTGPGADPQPYASVDLPADQFGFTSPMATKWAGDRAGRWAQLMAVARVMKAGAWSDGTRRGEEQYLPGHSRGRLQGFLVGKQLVGSDEQYAASFALIADQLGIPARTVFGAVVPHSGMVRGTDIHAWVEVRLADGHWVAVPPDSFVPPRDRHPAKPVVDEVPDTKATIVPPPAAVKPPGALDQLLGNDPSDGRIKPPDRSRLDAVPPIVWTVLVAVGIPTLLIGAYVGLVAGGKAIRRVLRRRRGSTRLRVAAGWGEVLDRARDLGLHPMIGVSRSIQAGLLPGNGLSTLAAAADAATFGPEPPSDDFVSGYWRDAAVAHRTMATGQSRRRRLRGVLDPRSLLRPSLRQKGPGLTR